MATNRRIAILGAGKIGESLLAGLLSSGWRKPADIIVTGRREERIEELKERHGLEATLDNAAAVADAGLIVIAVKPQDFDVLLSEVGGLIAPEQTVLSVAAAIPTSQIEARLAPGVPVVRAMPNAPAPVHEGIAGICSGAHAPRCGRACARDVHGCGHGGVRLRPGVFRAPRRGDDRGGDPPRTRPRVVDAARRADDARHG